MLESALKSIHLQDEFMRLVLTCGHLNQGCYLLLDNALWLNSISVLQLSKPRAKELSNWSNKFWLFSTILGLARDVHDLLNVFREESQAAHDKDKLNKYTLDETSGAYSSSSSSSSSASSESRQRRSAMRSILLNRKHHPLLLDTAKNVFDLFLPLSNLEFVKITPGTQGLFGLVSSLIGLLIVFDQRFKLSP
jgi:hypothetical protein